MTYIIKLTLKSIKKDSICHGLLDIKCDEYVVSASAKLFDEIEANAICNNLSSKKTFNKNFKLLNAKVVQI